MAGIAEIFLGPLQGLLSTLQSERHYKDKNTDEALLAIKSALLQTKKHIELGGHERDRAKEYELAELWSEASIKARRANIPFADALNEKSRYWEDQEVWEEDQAIAKGIKFSQIEGQLDELLSSS
ncbi:hypothetical protein EHS89_16070 [Amphritea balenae]|uniref:Uncharacterized protein n=1 Tax=Amphritea balenae TaxID=452629 RepID=A0A3P1SKS3_9GAMM|nr:hypothetical protein [Amphritea balenae]RRC97696.1 hypothetical protein EHS89_16070 [Amphritea balenae]